MGLLEVTSSLDIEENEKQAELKRIWNAIHEIKSLLSKHTADNSQTLENRPNPSNKEKSDNSERGSGHGNVINVIKSKTEESPLKRDPKRPVKHFITDYFEKKSSDDYFKHIDIKTKREQVFTKKIDELEVKLKLLEMEKSVLKQKVTNLESENSKLRTVIRKDENVKISKKYTISANNKTADVLPQDSKEKNHDIKDRKDTKPLVIVAGDSIIKDLNGRMMSRKNNVKIHCFPGSTTEDMTDFVKPLLKKNPSHFIFHVGTNDLSCNSPDKIVDSINSLVEIVSSKGVGCSVSNLTVRKDRLSEKAIEINRLLKDSIGGKIGIIDNTNLNESHLNGSGLHLNRRGSVALARNMINCIKSLDLSESSL